MSTDREVLTAAQATLAEAHNKLAAAQAAIATQLGTAPPVVTPPIITPPVVTPPVTPPNVTGPNLWTLGGAPWSIGTLTQGGSATAWYEVPANWPTDPSYVLVEPSKSGFQDAGIVATLDGAPYSWEAMAPPDKRLAKGVRHFLTLTANGTGSGSVNFYKTR